MDSDTKTNQMSIREDSESKLSIVNPKGLSQIARFVRNGRVSPYRVKLSAITEKVNQSFCGKGQISPAHLESLVRVSDLLLMKAEFVANGGRFPIRKTESVFDEKAESVSDKNFQTLNMLKNLIERNLHEISASYPRPKPPILVKSELKVPSQKRLVGIVERLVSKTEKRDRTLVYNRRTLDIRSAMRAILNRLKEGIQMLFDMLIIPNSTRFDIITNLLALLELVKLKRIDIYQQSEFGPILIEKR